MKKWQQPFLDRSPAYTDLNPHILSGAIAKNTRGRRTQGYKPDTSPQSWYTLLVVTSGLARLKLSDETRTVPGPALFLFGPGQERNIWLPVQSEYTWLDWGLIPQDITRSHNDPDRWIYGTQELQPTMQERFDCSIPTRLDQGLFKSSLALCMEANAFWWKNEMGLLRANGALAKWVGTLVEWYKKPFVNDRQLAQRAQELLTIASEHIEQNLTCARWAELAGISRVTLNTYIKNHLGETSQEALDSLKLDKSRQILAQDVPISQAAKASGFNSRTAFSSWFKRKTGISPKEWKRKK